MTRSIKRAPIVGNAAAASDKPFKRLEHGRERAGVRDALRAGRDLPSPRAYGDPARGPKDGKTWMAEPARPVRK